jgi:hypothetical protein
MNNELFICDCHSIEHQIIFIYDNDENWKAVYAQVHLNKKPFWKRVNYGLRYIFGRQCNFGAFDEFIFKREDADKLQMIIDHLKKP